MKKRPLSPEKFAELQEAGDPATPPGRLCELAQGDKPLRRAVASNPNTPTDWLIWLARREWRTVLQNPLLPLLLLEDPGFPSKLPVRALREMLKEPQIQPEFVSLLTRHPDLEIRESARLHRSQTASNSDQTPASERDLRPQLSVAGSAALAEMLEMGLAPGWILEAALEAEQGPIRARAAKIVARGNDFSIPVRKRLGRLEVAGASRDLKRISKSEHEMRPEELAELARGGPFARRLAAQNPGTPPESLAALCEINQEARVRRGAAANPSTPLGTLVSLCSTGGSDIRRVVAGNRSCSPALLDTLAGDGQAEVRRKVAAHRACPPGALARLGSDADDGVRAGVAFNAATDAATVASLVKDASKKVRASLAKRRGCPLPILQELLGDEDWRVARNAVRNSVVPGTNHFKMRRYFLGVRSAESNKSEAAAIIQAPPRPEELEEDRVRQLLQSARSQPEALAAVLAEIAAHPDPDIREWACHNPATPTQSLIRLARDAETKVRAMVAPNPSLPAEERLKLWRDPEISVRHGALRGPGLPLECYEEAARDPDEATRLQLLYSTGTPESVRLLMAREDTSEKVLEWLCGGSQNARFSDELLLTVIARFPGAPKKMVYLRHFSSPVLEAIVPQMSYYERKQLLFSQGYHRERGDIITPIPTQTLLLFCETRDDEAYPWAAKQAMRESIAKYWAVTPEALEAIARMELALADDQEDRMSRYLAQRALKSGGNLALIAGHPRTPPHLLTELLSHPSHQVRLAALDNPATPTEAIAARQGEALAAAARSTARTRRLCALAHPETPPETLRRFALQGVWMERYAVARNPGAPRDLLETLQNDANMAVAAAAQTSLAAQNSSQPAVTLY